MNTKFYTILILTLPLVSFGQFTFHDIDESNNGNYVTEVVTTESGIAVATRGDNILCEYDGSTWTKYDYTTYGFTGNTAISKVSDLKEFFGSYWIAYRSTIDVLNSDGTITTLTSSSSELQADNVAALAFNNDFTSFFAYQNSSGISTLRLGDWTHDNNHQDGMAPLNDVFRATLIEYDAVNDIVWIYDGGDIYEVKDGTATKHSVATGIPVSLGSDDVTGMAVTDDGKVWFSINDNSFENGGLLVYDGATWQHISSANSDLPDEDIRAIAAHGNNLVIGGATNKKISYYNGTTWTTYTDANSNYPDFGPQFFYDMTVWEDRVFVGSSNGVIELDLNTITSTKENSSNYNMLISPNPVAKTITIEAAHLIQRIDIWNSYGQLVLTVPGDQNQIDLDTLDSGHYYLQALLHNGRVLQEQIVKL